MTTKTTADLRVPRLRLHDGTVVLPALFAGPKRTFSATVPADTPDRVQRNGQSYRLAASQPAPHSYVLYEAIPDASGASRG